MRRTTYFPIIAFALLLGGLIFSAASSSAAAPTQVEGKITDAAYFETAETVLRVATLRLADSTELPVVTMGGTRADGTELVVSHQPELMVGSTVRLKEVQPAQPEMVWDLVAAGYDGAAPVVAIGGEDAETVLQEGPSARAHRLTGWKVTSMPMKYTVASSGLSTSVRNGIALWENDKCSAVDATYTGTATGSFAVDGKNTISWQSSSKFPDPTLLGMASVAYRDGEVVEWDIGFNNSASFSSSPTAGNYDMQSVAAHEFGHVLGLAHATTTSELMWAILPIGKRKTLASGDITGLRSLYKSPCETTPTTPTKTCGGKQVTVFLSKGQKPTSGDDVIRGTRGRDVIYGGGGNDIICGRGGDDYIRGGPGHDRIYGQRGEDTIYGEDGRDKLIGGSSADKLYGGGGRDRLWGKTGDDYLDGGPRWDACYGGRGRDRESSCNKTTGIP